MDRRFRLVDVFGERPLTGNPLAVVIDSDGLDTGEMLEITRWLGFSETTFLQPAADPAADYGVRIFTLAGELPFAGHPTLGSCHVWQSLADESLDEIVQECGAGLVRLRRSDDRLAFEAPDLIRDGPVDEVEVAELALVLGVEMSDIVATRWVDNGPGWLGVLLRDADVVLSLQPDFSAHPRSESLDIGVVGMYPEGSEFRYEVRAFFSGERGEMLEDPVTGSLNASVAQWLLAEGSVETPYVASQGTMLGRSGRIHISGDADSVWVGGRVFDVVGGSLSGSLGRVAGQT
jgi:PhzF family phenazine biosynthesis protein